MDMSKVSTDLRDLEIAGPPNEDYVCVKCSKILVAPVRQLKCGHRICNICFSQYVHTSAETKCPGKKELCIKTDLANRKHASRDYGIEEELDNVCVYCTNRRHGCQSKMLYKHLNEHLKLCKPNEKIQNGAEISDASQVGGSFSLLKILCDTESQINSNTKTIDAFAKSLANFGNDIPKLASDMKECSLRIDALESQENETQHFVQKIEMCAKEVQEQDAHLESIKNNLEHCVHLEGKLIWKIKPSDLMSPFSQSPPFYTNRNGYKMCIRIYDVSEVFEVRFGIMKGEVDALLPWPFQQEVKIELLNLDRKEPKTVTFKPNQATISLRRPEVGTNIITDDCTWLKMDRTYLQLGTEFNKEGYFYIRIMVDVNVPIGNNAELYSDGEPVFAFDESTIDGSPVTMLANMTSSQC